MKIQTTKTVLLSIVLMLTMLLFFQACDKTSETNFVGTHMLEKNKAKETIAEGNKIWIEAKEFTDSRCPINVDCVWAGVATAKISFKDDTKEQTIELCLGACDVVSKPKMQEITIKNIDYTVELSDLSPYPKLGDKPDNSKATLIIKKK